MQQLEAMDVQQALGKLLTHYPESGHNSNTLGRLAFDWFDLLKEEGVTRPQFSAGVRHAVKTCRFFPKLADVLDGVKSYRTNPPAPRSAALQIEEHTAAGDNLTPEELERNRERVRLIVSALAGRMSFDEAETAVSRMGRITEFSTMETKQAGGAAQ